MIIRLLLKNTWLEREFIMSIIIDERIKIKSASNGDGKMREKGKNGARTR